MLEITSSNKYLTNLVYIVSLFPGQDGDAAKTNVSVNNFLLSIISQDMTITSLLFFSLALYFD